MELVACLTTGRLDGPAFMALATAIGLAVLMFWTSRQDYFFGREHFLVSNAAMVWWLLAAAVEQATPTLACKVAAATLTWPAIVLVPTSWTFFLRHYCYGLDRGRLTREWTISGLLVLAVTLMAATNPLHGLFYGAGTRLEVVDGRASGVFDHGLLFYSAAVVLYLFLVTSVAIVSSAAFRAPRSMRVHFLILLFGTSAPLLANLSYIGVGATFMGFDPTPYAFAFTLLMFTWVIYTNRMFDITVLARDLIYYEVPDPVVVINADGLVAGVNPAARVLLPDLRPGDGIPPDHALAPIQKALVGSGVAIAPHDLSLGGRDLTLKVLPIRQPLGDATVTLGAVALMTDMTEVRRNEKALADALALTRDQVLQISALRDEAERLALIDPLTGLENRRALETYFTALAGATPERGAFTLALLDLDHFKELNDTHGHAAGDRVLWHFAQLMREALPGRSHAFRVGGEEFVILFPSDTAGGAGARLEKLREALVATPTPQREGDTARLIVTFSAGLAQYPGDGETLSGLTARADQRLYIAKRMGRNRTVHLDDLTNGGNETPSVLRDFG
ncbi:MAG: diguanylate cyclase [Rhodobacteraceae bacterium]|nr:diguanylate cyclase [Paracoccaceae bacterium]